MMALVYQYKGQFTSYDLYMAYLGFIALKPIILGLILISKLLLSCRRKSIELPPDTKRAEHSEEVGEVSFFGKLVFHTN